MKNYFLLISLLSVVIFSCKKGSATSSITADATIIYQGSPISDGCGYLIQIDTTHTKPSAFASNLDAAYLVDQLKVRITYHVTAAHGFSCGMRAFVPNDPNNGDVIYVDAISKR